MVSYQNLFSPFQKPINKIKKYFITHAPDILPIWLRLQLCLNKKLHTLNRSDWNYLHHFCIFYDICRYKILYNTKLDVICNVRSSYTPCCHRASNIQKGGVISLQVYQTPLVVYYWLARGRTILLPNSFGSLPSLLTSAVRLLETPRRLFHKLSQ